jgi:hypothetical protein
MLLSDTTIESTMRSTTDEKLISIQQQIVRLEQDYETALHLGKEFEILKNIRIRIRTLKEIFNDLVN